MTSELFAAIEQHDLSLVRTLLSQGADPNATNEEGWLPLQVAIGEFGYGGSVECISLLIEYGADVNAWDANHNETPIITASYPPKIEAARILLEAGADTNVRRSDGESPLRLSVWNDDLELAALLLRHGAVKTIDDFGGDLARTALGIAAQKFNIPMIELLLQEGADPEATDDSYETARDYLPPREEHDPQTWDRVMEMLGCRKA